MAGQFTVSGLSAGLLSGQKTIGPFTITGTGNVGEILSVALVSGDNTITIPPNAIAVWILQSIPAGAALKVRTNLNSGDAGLPIAVADPFGPYSFRGLAPTSLIINASASLTVELSFI